MMAAEEENDSGTYFEATVLHDSNWSAKTFGALLEDPSTHDVTFKTSDGGSVSAHRVIVAAGSPVFHAMLYGNMKEGSEKEISLPTVDTKTYSNLLKFIYTGTVEVESESFESLLDAAQFFNIASLEVKVAEFIADSLDIKSFFPIVTIACNRKFDQLLGQCLIFMYSNASVITKDPRFNTLSHDVILEFCKSSELNIEEINLFLAVNQWYQTNKGELPNAIVENIFQQIRYPLISKADLYEKVRPTKMADISLYTAALEYHLFPGKFDGLSSQVVKREASYDHVQTESAFTNLTPKTITLTETPNGTVLTKTGKSAWNGLCVAKVEPTEQQPVHFKLHMESCMTYSGIRLSVQSCSLDSFVINCPVGMNVDTLTTEQENDGSISVSGNIITTTIGGGVSTSHKRNYPIYLCVYMFHTNCAIRISF